MTNIITNPLAWQKAQFHREDGLATVEFVAMFPIALLILFIAGESAVVNMRKTNLDRALEMTIREVRLGIVQNPTSSSLRSTICQRMGNPNNCENDLTLEMDIVDPLVINMTMPSLTATCVNRAATEQTEQTEQTEETEEIDVQNQLVLVRACYVIDVIFPTSVASITVADSVGTEHRLISTTAFVHEPG